MILGRPSVLSTSRTSLRIFIERSFVRGALRKSCVRPLGKTAPPSAGGIVRSFGGIFEQQCPLPMWISLYCAPPRFSIPIVAGLAMTFERCDDCRNTRVAEYLILRRQSIRHSYAPSERQHYYGASGTEGRCATVHTTVSNSDDGVADAIDAIVRQHSKEQLSII